MTMALAITGSGLALAQDAPNTVADELNAVAAAERHKVDLELRRDSLSNAATQLRSLIVEAGRASSAAQANLDALGGQQAATANQLADAHQGINAISRAIYVDGADAIIGASTQSAVAQIYSESLSQRWLLTARRLLTLRSEVALSTDVTAAQLAAGNERTARLTASEQQLVADQTAVAAELTAVADEIVRRRQRLLTAHSADEVPGTDIPVVALVAYERAVAWANGAFPTCAISWWNLAAIGKAESNHGRFAGSQPALDGRVLPVIRGIALDGTASLAIADSDLGVLDGDIVWDRAVGPTQFIPTTWNGYGQQFDLDGDSNGNEDPDNIFDAARATAIFLCRNAGGSLATPEAQRRAVWAYNPSENYWRVVSSYIAVYSTLIVPDLTNIELSTLGKLVVPAAIALDQLPPIIDPATVGEPPVTDPIVVTPPETTASLPPESPGTASPLAVDDSTSTVANSSSSSVSTSTTVAASPLTPTAPGTTP
jgi:membrane-bound lytic murein transglycosylase B